MLYICDRSTPGLNKDDALKKNNKFNHGIFSSIYTKFQTIARLSRFGHIIWLSGDAVAMFQTLPFSAGGGGVGGQHQKISLIPRFWHS